MAERHPHTTRGYSGRTILIAGVVLVTAAVLVVIVLQVLGFVLGAIVGVAGLMLIMLGFGRIRAENEDDGYSN